MKKSKRAVRSEGSHSITVEPYSNEVILVNTKRSYNFVRKENKLKKLMGPWEEMDGSVTRFVRGGATYYVVAISKKTYSVVIHEAVHLAQMILEDRGVKYIGRGTESLAYTVEYICRLIGDAIGDKIEA